MKNNCSHDFHENKFNWWVLDIRGRANYRVAYNGTHCKRCGDWTVILLNTRRMFVKRKSLQTLLINKTHEWQ